MRREVSVTCCGGEQQQLLLTENVLFLLETLETVSILPIQRPPVSTAFKTNNLSLHCGDLPLDFADLRHYTTVIRLCALKES